MFIIPLLIAWIGFSGQMAENGHPIDCKLNPAENVCVYKVNN